VTEPIDPWNPGDSVNFRGDVSYVWWQHYLTFGVMWRNHDIYIVLPKQRVGKH